MNSFFVHFLAEDRVIHRGDCLSLVLPVSDGLMGIQAGHSNMICAVVPGSLKLSAADGEVITAEVGGGLVKVEDNDVLILVERALLPGEQDNRSAQEAEEARREAELARKATLEYKTTQLTMLRTTNRLRKNRSGEQIK